jgi:hypothetical protein
VIRNNEKKTILLMSAKWLKKTNINELDGTMFEWFPISEKVYDKLRNWSMKTKEDGIK